jgi:Galactose oxidase, central domain
VKQCVLNPPNTLVWSTLKANSDKPSKTCPVERNAHSSVCHNNNMFVFGGQDEDNNKLGDLWEFNIQTKAWAQVKYSGAQTEDIARSGHAAVAFGGKMFVFGGILEVTKELNDLLVYDFKTQKLSIHEQRDGPDSLAYNSKLEETLAKASVNDGTHSPMGRGRTLTSPTRKGMAGMSPNRRSTMGQQSPNTSALLKSPTKKGAAGQTTTTSAGDQKGASSGEDKGLSSPTSVSMQNSFIIKNADESFDLYYQQMKRRRHLTSGFTQNLDASGSSPGA